MLCGGEEGNDFCNGDEGGPLIAQVDNKFTLVLGVKRAAKKLELFLSSELFTPPYSRRNFIWFRLC